MMRNLMLIAVALVALFSQQAMAFAPRSALVSRVVMNKGMSLSAAGKGKAAVEESEYWQGDWVCADCGYVFDKDIDGGGLWFEQQKKGFICPQCRFVCIRLPSIMPLRASINSTTLFLSFAIPTVPALTYTNTHTNTRISFTVPPVGDTQRK